MKEPVSVQVVLTIKKEMFDKLDTIADYKQVKIQQDTLKGDK